MGEQQFALRLGGRRLAQWWWCGVVWCRRANRDACLAVGWGLGRGRHALWLWLLLCSTCSSSSWGALPLGGWQLSHGTIALERVQNRILKCGCHSRHHFPFYPQNLNCNHNCRRASAGGFLTQQKPQRGCGSRPSGAQSARCVYHTCVRKCVVLLYSRCVC